MRGKGLDADCKVAAGAGSFPAEGGGRGAGAKRVKRG